MKLTEGQEGMKVALADLTRVRVGKEEERCFICRRIIRTNRVQVRAMAVHKGCWERRNRIF